MAVLSIQSHVVYGYAGNTAAVFPMQRLGKEVWAINTVEFSNHTGYGSWRGRVLGADFTAELFSGLEDRDVLHNCEAILSGYLGDAAVGMAIIDAVKKTKAKNPASLYCCDPVMGDAGRGLYVKKDIPDMFKNGLVPLADIVCPNQFELETLTGINIKTIGDAVKAINILHEMGPSIVLVTSFREKKGELGMLVSGREPHILQPLHSNESFPRISDGMKPDVYKISTPELPIGYDIAGTGDMTASVFLSRFLETKNLVKTLELCTASVFGILESGLKTVSLNDKNKPMEYSKGPMELKIIEAQDQLVAPTSFFKAVKVDT